jgi:hypothetical protein
VRPNAPENQKIVPYRSWVTFIFPAFVVFAIAVWFSAILLQHPRKPPATPPAPQRIVTVCSGCGSEWESAGPAKPITTCPNCPLSDDEWERLKKQVRERKAGGGE